MSTLYVDNLEPNLGSRVMAAGHVVQVVEQDNTTETITSSTSFVDTSLLATITPSSTSSKILIVISASFFGESGSLTSFTGSANVTRNGTSVKEFNRVVNIRAAAAGGLTGYGSQGSIVFLDSPSSTSALTYKLQLNCSDANINVRINKDGVSRSSITLMEIAQ